MFLLLVLISKEETPPIFYYQVFYSILSPLHSFHELYSPLLSHSDAGPWSLDHTCELDFFGPHSWLFSEVLC